MALTGTRTYVGFGFGAIQAGLFLYEAFCSGAFRRLVVAEVLPKVVSAVRASGGHYNVNVACSDRIELAEVGPVESENPSSEPDRIRLLEAIVEAEEIGTAVPSVAHYVSQGPGSLHRTLAEGLRKKVARGGPRVVIYTAENHNRAAEILESKVVSEIPEKERESVRSRVRFLNTVIGKMSGVVSDPEQIQKQALVTVTREDRRAFLVEPFNRILISKIRFEERDDVPLFARGISVFEEKEDLLPFEEAKLYGHNATHALAAYLGAVRGVSLIADLRDVPGVLPFLHAAFIEESGEALIRKYSGEDALFTPEGYGQYADDLLARMTNPYLGDTVERVGRDPARKLGWDDRLVGTMRLALREGLQPLRYALGAAAALATLDRSVLDVNTPVTWWLNEIWNETSPEEGERETMTDLVEDARRRLRSWRKSGFPNLEDIVHKND